MLSLFASVLLFLAYLVQLPGYFGTCTQGANGPFVSGAVLSLPILSAAGVLAVIEGLQIRRRSGQGARFGSLFGLVTLVFGGIGLVIANKDAWIATLIPGASPCGPEYASFVMPYSLGNIIVGIGYGVAPMALALAAGWALRQVQPWCQLADSR